MPQGIFLIIHDEIKGPELVNSYFRQKIEINRDFVSKLYLSHAGFSSNACIEMKFGDYKILSCFTGDQARISEKEGILALILENSEPTTNLELFLEKNIHAAIQAKNNSYLEELLETKFAQHLALLGIYQKISLENISGIYLFRVEKDNPACLLRIDQDNKSLESINTTLKTKINAKNQTSEQNSTINELEIPDLNWFLIHTDNLIEYYLVIDGKPHNRKEFREIIDFCTPYLQKQIYSALEILSICLIPEYITLNIKESENQLMSYQNTKSIAKNLQRLKQHEYGHMFNKIFHAIVNEQALLMPLS